MKPLALLIAGVAYITAAVSTFLVIRAISVDSPELSFIVGAILGSQVGAVIHHRQPGAEPTARAKVLLGIALAVCASAVGVALHVAVAPFKFAEISIPLGAVGSFVFPFVLFNQMWQSLSKKDAESRRPDA